MQIKLINRSADWLDTIWASIRTCKSGKGPIELIREAKGTEYDKKLRLVLACKNAGHTSVFEHVSMTFAVEGVSRALLAQYTRHRHLSFSVQSQRYVSMGTVGVVEPPTLGKSVLDCTIVGDGVLGFNDRKEWNSTDVFNRAVGLAHNAYALLISCGVPKEDARMVLPMGTECNMVTSMNLRSLLELHEKRVTTKGAQWEIRDMVSHMVDLVIETEPWTEVLFE